MRRIGMCESKIEDQLEVIHQMVLDATTREQGAEVIKVFSNLVIEKVMLGDRAKRKRLMWKGFKAPEVFETEEDTSSYESFTSWEPMEKEADDTDKEGLKTEGESDKDSKVESFLS